MCSRPNFVALLLVCTVAAVALGGCSFEPGERTQLAGQECYSDSQCVEGLVCVDRRCRPEGAVATADAAGDSGNPDGTDDTGDAGHDVPPQTDAEPEPDAPPTLDTGVPHECQPGESRCSGGSEMQQCGDDGRWEDPVSCGQEDCADGQCMPPDPEVCTGQDQICNEEGYNNGFWCADLGGSDELRCLGICDRTADDPNSTCPDPGSVCAFGDSDQGVCMSGCTLSEGCNDPSLGCLPLDGQESEGICTPTNSDNKVGDRCDSDDFFDCEEGAFCINLQQGGRCVEGCRPYSRAFDLGTDCSEGHCVPLTDTIGMCRPDAGDSTPGDSCRSRQIMRACNQDATGCFPSGGFEGPQCYRFCRLGEGDSDCTGQQSCEPYDQSRDDVGLCQ